MLVTDLLGVVAVAAVVLLGATVWPGPVIDRSEWAAYACGFIALSIFGQIAYVRLRHGATDEELTFFEIVVAAAILVLPPAAVLITTLTGVFIGELIIRRPWVKIAFNMGLYAASTSAMIVTYHVLSNDAQSFSLQSVLALLTASVVFATVNLAVIARLLNITTGASPGAVIREEWRLSAVMAIGSAGVAAMAVALAEYAPWLLPFTALPALALWYAYGAAAQHVEARERNRWLVRLGGALALHGQEADPSQDSAEAIRQIVGAPQMAIVHPGTEHRPGAWSEAALIGSRVDAGPRPLAPRELPPDWTNGVITRLDLGASETGALLLGASIPYAHSRVTGRTRGWQLAEADGPVLGALVAAVGSAMRAGAAFDSLTEETAKLTAVVDNTSDGIAMVDDAGSIRLWSRTMARMTGVHGTALAGTDLDHAPEIVRTLLGAAGEATTPAGRTPTPVQVHLTREDGEELDVSVAAVRVREATTSANTDSPGWVRILTVHDETRERRVERMKTDFVATISHELRTPITPIKGYAYLLAKHSEKFKDEESRAQALNVIMDSSDHLERLVDDLLMASRGVTHGGRLKIEMGVENLQDVVAQAVATFPQMAHRIRLDLPSEPVAIQCDHVRAVQCLSNLIGNAEKYTPADSTLEIWATVSPMLAEIHVRDHGPGIPASEQAKVFERFYRREDPFTMRTGGAGLGLHIARELAMAMGGALTLATPAEGEGAEFTLHLLTDQAPRVGASASSGMLAPSPAPAAEGTGALPGDYTPEQRDHTGTASTTSGPEDATMDPGSGAAPDNRLTATRE